MLLDKPSSRDILLQTALATFGRQGFEGTTTRAIAEAAGMPMSQITYHFGGKEGLYLGCAQMIADRMAQIIGPALDAIEADLARAPTAAVARAGLRRLLGELAEAMLNPATLPLSRFMLREQAEPSRAFAMIYDAAIGRLLGLMARLVALTTGKDAMAAKVQAMAMIGQIIAFRVAQASVQRFIGWDPIGPDQIAVIRQTILGNIDAICAALEKDRKA